MLHLILKKEEYMLPTLINQSKKSRKSFNNKAVDTLKPPFILKVKMKDKSRLNIVTAKYNAILNN